MHPDLSTHLHTPECNELLAELHRCHKENPVMKFVGWCTEIDTQLGKCLDKERIEKRKKNQEKSRFFQERLKTESPAS
jgi:COX assembly protein 2